MHELTPVIILKSSPAMCPGEPVPDEPCVSWPGRARASAISSLTELTGSEGCTTSTFGITATCVIGAKSVSGLYGRFLYRLALIVRPFAAISMVYPSPSAFAVASAAMLPLAPARLSTTTGCCSASVSFCATTRAMMSVEPPAANPTMKRSGRLGKGAVCAKAVCAATQPAAAISAKRHACGKYAAFEAGSERVISVSDDTRLLDNTAP